MAGADSGVEAASRVIVVDSDSDDELEVAFLGSSAHASALGECECAKTALIDEVTHLAKVVQQVTGSERRFEVLWRRLLIAHRVDAVLE